MLSGKAEAVLKKYRVGPCTRPRKTWFTFEEDGFYRVQLIWQALLHFLSFKFFV